MNLDSPLSDPWSEDDSLDMTSLIDVVFLLLAFFILAATFAVPAMDVRLSEAKNTEGAKPDEKSLTISVDSEGKIYHGRVAIDEAGLKEIIAAHPAQFPIYFNVDRDAPFGAFLAVLDEAKGQKRERFMINANAKVDAPGPEAGSGADLGEGLGPGPVGAAASGPDGTGSVAARAEGP
ncbi:MAG: biopolymer transporter ExbD [Deltaproteobacteria bacterium]|jgi:biopolymer transport protein ExbD|nr:biopolymer transporter ExbD [Deltaproteobacteria bacterium]